jgi:RNA ligase
MITYKEIKPYIEKKLVSENIHPEDPDVYIFNYTQRAQFEKAWDEVTMQCRGLIINVKTGEILARPFKKFFNYEEYIANGWKIPEEKPIVTKKYDGSLGILYRLNGKPWVATRGAFTSDQAVWATKWYRENIGIMPPAGETVLVEVIYPKNRIVVNYDFSGLVFLASIDIKTGEQLPKKGMNFMPKLIEVERINSDNFTDLAKLDIPNSEGFVIYFPKSETRMKIKFPEYVRLHKLITGVSEIAIWEHMMEGKTLDDLLDKVPDEFFQWVKEVERKLRIEFNKLWIRVSNVEKNIRRLPTRKEKAIMIMKHAKNVSGPIFSLMDGHEKKAKESVWKMVRPHGNSQFKMDMDL